MINSGGASTRTYTYLSNPGLGRTEFGPPPLDHLGRLVSFSSRSGSTCTSTLGDLGYHHDAFSRARGERHFCMGVTADVHAKHGVIRMGSENVQVLESVGRGCSGGWQCDGVSLGRVKKERTRHSGSISHIRAPGIWFSSKIRKKEIMFLPGPGCITRRHCPVQPRTWRSARMNLEAWRSKKVYDQKGTNTYVGMCGFSRIAGE
ncbi:hypothetical protein AG1IA_08707 [Rhizoctonia solani AG-1 IA]|uniref:Uncharacterized protein n=1 Tax=Thanatephorus cucumeris (strain AG1-IA) TaxID=983506 RepID=L8WH67_THACA|nr:hypothetical protein AG1IA_08707 [Rhizoctonia solani AG-1 IA]